MRIIASTILILTLVFMLGGCKEKITDPSADLPVVKTNEVTQMAIGLPTIGVTVHSKGASDITQLALCYGNSPHPDLNGEHFILTPYNDATDPYTMGRNLYNLTPGATYYVRAFAKNSHGEIWSNEISFVMLPMLWDQIETGTQRTLTSVHFHNENLGWVCGSEGTIRKSTDGGDTWTGVSSGTTSYLSDMQWLDENKAWIVGNDNTVLKTSTGGSSWQMVDTGFTPASGYSAVFFENQDLGYIMTIYGAVYKTDDGGDSWSQIRNESTIVFDDLWSQGETIILAGQGLRISNNGGTTWRKTLVLAHEYKKILYREPGTLWVVGDNEGDYNMTFYKSDDLGITWTHIPNYSHKDFRSIALAPGTQKLWAVGGYGNIYSSEDDGLHWSLNYNNTLNTIMLYSVCAISETKVWIVGTYGTLLRLKTDAGKKES